MSHKYIGKTCPYCQFPLKADSEVVECRACKVPHHRECWVENGGCTTFGCRETIYKSMAEERIEITLGETLGRGSAPARRGGISKLLVAVLAMTLVVLTVMIFAYINLLRDGSLVTTDPDVAIPADAEASQIDEAKRKEIIDFMEEATSNWVASIAFPVFSDPNEIRDADLIFILLFNGMTPSYSDDYLLGFKGTDVQQTASVIFGSDFKEIKHKSIDGEVWEWEDSLQEYHIYGFGVASFTETHVISIKEEQGNYVVDVVHLFYGYDSYDETDETEVYDENDNLVTVLKGNEKISDAKLKDLPIRRYILKKTNDGGFFITQSIRM